MSIAALFAWILTVFGGLVLLMIWIIEYDSEFQGSAATRLPVPVISTHALLGMGGLALWFSYILIDQDRLAWASVAVVGAAAVLGLAMAARWIRVYRTFARPGPGLTSKRAVPPERNFPLPVVIAHGLLAVTTIVLVLFTVLGGSLCQLGHRPPPGRVLMDERQRRPNLIIDVDENEGTATSRSYFTVFQSLPGFPLQAIASGRYHDRFRRHDK
jgi:hypothetical protein